MTPLSSPRSVRLPIRRNDAAVRPGHSVPSAQRLALVKKGRTRKAPVQYVPFRLSSPSYNAAEEMVTLIPQGKITTGTYRLFVISSASGGVLNASGQQLVRGDETFTLTG
jgi:hypothetical protein